MRFTAGHLADAVDTSLRGYGLDLTDSRTWPWDDKSQKQIGSSSIVVTYPPKEVLPPVDLERQTVFTHAFDPGDVTLYFHIPFCSGRCRYCGFRSSCRSELNQEHYIDSMLKEVQLVDRKTGLQERSKVASAYVGGGTPTLLEDRLLIRLLDFLRTQFCLRDDAELTVEASPETVTPTKARILKDYGVTRVSLGVQSFSDRILVHMKRRHSARDVRDALGILRREGHENINIDLIKCYPGMTLGTVAHDLNETLKLSPESVTTYELAIRRNSQLGDEQARHAYERGFPFHSPQKQITQSHSYDLGLTEMGYAVGPVGWYTRSEQGRYAQQFHKWRDNLPLLGFGNSAYGFFDNSQYYNCDTELNYVERMANNRLPLEFGFNLDSEERLRRKLLFGLKVGLRSPFKALECANLSESIIEGLRADLRALIEKRVIVDKGDENYVMTPLGRIFSENVCHHLFSPKVRALMERGDRLQRT